MRITEADNNTTVVVTDINQFDQVENSFLTNNQFLETEKRWCRWDAKNGYSGILSGITPLSKNEKRCILQINPSAPQLNALFKIL